LTRQIVSPVQGVEVFLGGLDNIEVLKSFVAGANAMFHCAAELHDENLMHQTNVIGTKNILEAMSGKNISYLCHLSSVGVMGSNLSGLVDEKVKCHPEGVYEKSKFEAERLVQESGVCKTSIILRPTNIIDATELGILALAESGIMNRVKLFVKGSENAHLIHVSDVSGAAIYFSTKTFDETRKTMCYIVSLDETSHKIGQVCELFQKISGGKKRTKAYISWRFLYWVRRFIKGSSLRGDVSFSAREIRKNGYRFNYDINTLVSEVVDRNGMME
jgi:nucleoside-diphosphate-sugar epimerase